MELRKKIVSLIIIILCTFELAFIGYRQDLVYTDNTNALIVPKQTLRLWYTDEALTDYLSSVALSFYEQTDIRVIPELVSGLEYIENIYEASIEGKDAPDLFLVSNDSLEKAYLAGVAQEIKDNSALVSTTNFPKSAIQAVTYKDTLVGYPFYFETSIFLYNKTYLSNYVTEQAKQERIAAGEFAETDEAAANFTLLQNDLENGILNILPNTIDDILTFSQSYDAPENVEAVFRWDVTDIFYNYFFVGNSISVGGDNGDDIGQINIYNENAIRSLRVYQDLNQFFAIDTEEINYEKVLQEFIEGKILYTVVTTDAIAKLEAAAQEGTFTYEYGTAMIPDVSTEIPSGSLSVTNAVVINGYSTHSDSANAFAQYLVGENADQVYARTGKLPAKQGVLFENYALYSATQEYATSSPITKMIEASNFWVQLEICFTRAWDGDDVGELLKGLSEQIMTQVTGEPYTEEEIYVPEDEAVEEEYSDYVEPAEEDTTSDDGTVSTE